MPSRPAKYQQQQIRAYLTGSSQSSMSSYDPRQSTNPNFIDDRRVINNSVSLRVTVSNNVNNNNRNQNQNEIDYNYQQSSETCLLIILIIEYYYFYCVDLFSISIC